MKNLFFALLLLPAFTFSQKTYTVGPKETLFSIGRALNIHPRELAEYNNIPFETGVKVGQVLKIPAVKKMAPLTDAPAATTTPATTATTKPAEKPVAAAVPVVKPATPVTTKPVAANPSPAPATPVAKPAATAPVTSTTPKPASDMVPVYHKVEKKETLFQISQNAKVSMDDIKKWNKLTVDGVNEGTNLIVGYKKKNAETAVKTATPATPAIPVAAQTKPVVAETPVPSVPAPTPAVVKTEPAVSGGVVRNFNGGAFGVAYGTQHNGEAPSNSESGVAAIFKSTSGWNDGKYYCLHNSAPAGSVIKITSRSTQKFIYAKVLDVIPDLKQNEGLLIRLSNAAADELGVATETFNVTLQY